MVDGVSPSLPPPHVGRNKSVGSNQKEMKEKNGPGGALCWGVLRRLGLEPGLDGLVLLFRLGGVLWWG
jgi:hypothetical protein